MEPTIQETPAPPIHTVPSTTVLMRNSPDHALDILTQSGRARDGGLGTPQYAAAMSSRVHFCSCQAGVLRTAHLSRSSAVSASCAASSEAADRRWASATAASRSLSCACAAERFALMCSACCRSARTSPRSTSLLSAPCNTSTCVQWGTTAADTSRCSIAALLREGVPAHETMKVCCSTPTGAHDCGWIAAPLRSRGNGLTAWDKKVAPVLS